MKAQPTDVFDAKRVVVSAVLVDQSRMFAEALAAACAPPQHGISIRAIGEGGNEAVLLSRVHQPQVLLIEPVDSGPPLDLIVSAVHQYSPSTRVVLLAATPSEDCLQQAFAFGVWGHLSKSESLVGLLEYIRRVPNARRARIPINHQSQVRLSRGPAVLSIRELDVLEQMAEGKSNAEIADALSIATGTVKRHLANLYRKLGVTTRIDALRRGLHLGLLQLHV
ncbi:DNA-binding response regulator [Cryobacterium melibiosiphilum]|uniref:DNA-binding response regulator n=1 Tax=Cryobacterium melibiosiphilum TaxID=995039 RepID=A0A3A5MW67_9MICO|nr:response regulator transcription factor [Cryobacterium melibiosiphilum]RJT91523.1 DNA-binding response regulator [Cryobacterium melibiosiphilum]